MEQFVVQGQQKLSGEIKVNGAKNCALKILAASLLSKQKITIDNVPEIEDIFRLIEILEDIGARVKRVKAHHFEITPPAKPKLNLDKDLVCKLRASIVLLGPMLARFGKVSLPHPGGCIIGKRPIDLFIDSFKLLGATVKQQNDAHVFSAPTGLKGQRIVFPKISVTATESVMLAATLAKGKTTLVNAACEPEIPALATYLNAQGAKIKGAGTPFIEIEGVNSLSAGHFLNIPDRLEAGSFVIMAAATKSKLKITHCEPMHLEVPLSVLNRMGVKFKVGSNYIQVNPTQKINAYDFVTREYPGFPTDLQGPLSVLLTQAQGTSAVQETIFENRFMYIDVLNRMGAQMQMNNLWEIDIKGPTKLYGKHMESPDIRAGIALLIAALMAKGESRINNIYQIDRGYENIEKRLQKIGAKIKRINK